MRASTFLILLATLLLPSPCSAITTLSDEELLQSRNNLNMIEQGLKMIDSSTSLIGNYFKSEKEELQRERLELWQERQTLLREKNNLDSREKALDSRRKVLDDRETSYWEWEAALQRQAKKLRNARPLGIVIIVGAAILAAAGGYALGSAR